MKPGVEWRTTGFFGKLPGRGDFIGRHLPKSFLEPWDAWLQAAVAHSRGQLGESWRESYCTSPIWRFALGAGLCGPSACAGILMPSVDRVGRYYPLIIAAPLVPNSLLLTLPVCAEAWFQQAECLALDALDRNELELDEFSGQVMALDGPSPTDFATMKEPVGDAWYCPLPEPIGLLQASPMLAGRLLEKGFPQPSLWWTEGSEHIARCLLICAGMPPIAGFAALLAGDWRQYGWNEQSLVGVDDGSDKSIAAEEEQS